jgi:sugar phosphate permease
MPDAPHPTRRLPAPLAALVALYRPEPAQPPIADEAARRRAFLVWRWRMFLGFFLGYFVLYFCRKNISNAMPHLAMDLGYSNTTLGIIGTALYITYGIGKFANGVLADRASIRRFMATGLIVSGLLNLWFASVASLWLMALVWGLNGWFQSMGFPPIARGMTLWYPAEGKSTRWAFWTCSHQAGTAAIMALTAWILTWGTWRACFYLPAVMCIAMGFVLLWLLADTPESRGLPSATAFQGDAVRPATEAPGEFRRLFVAQVLRNRNVWAIGLMDLCVYVVRFGTLDWTTKFLIEGKGYDKGDAGFVATLLPIGGVIGVLVSGFVADVVFKARYRVLNLVFLAALGGCLVGLFAAGRGSFWLDVLCLVGIGFFVEGPQSILGGVGAVDAGGSARVASSAAGLVGFLAYFGASLSGVGTGLAIDRVGWSGAFGFWLVCVVVGLLVGAFLWQERPLARAQRAASSGGGG